MKLNMTEEKTLERAIFSIIELLNERGVAVVFQTEGVETPSHRKAFAVRDNVELSTPSSFMQLGPLFRNNNKINMIDGTCPLAVVVCNRLLFKNNHLDLFMSLYHEYCHVITWTNKRKWSIKRVETMCANAMVKYLAAFIPNNNLKIKFLKYAIDNVENSEQYKTYNKVLARELSELLNISVNA